MRHNIAQIWTPHLWKVYKNCTDVCICTYLEASNPNIADQNREEFISIHRSISLQNQKIEDRFKQVEEDMSARFKKVKHAIKDIEGGNKPDDALDRGWKYKASK